MGPWNEITRRLRDEVSLVDFSNKSLTWSLIENDVWIIIESNVLAQNFMTFEASTYGHQIVIVLNWYKLL